VPHCLFIAHYIAKRSEFRSPCRSALAGACLAAPLRERQIGT
jgi:hypothetical protein